MVHQPNFLFVKHEFKVTFFIFFQIINYQNSTILEMNKEIECVICYEDFNLKDHFQLKLPCVHIFGNK
jgi:hypothetical protein